jgi:hypothetical protein
VSPNARSRGRARKTRGAPTGGNACGRCRHACEMVGQHVPHDFESRIDRPCLHSVLLALRDERLKSAQMYLPQHEIPDEGVKLPQQAGIIRNALLVFLSG